MDRCQARRAAVVPRTNHHGVDGDLRPNLRSEVRRRGVLRYSGPKNEGGGNCSIVGVEERRWNLPAPKIEDGGILRSSEPEDRRAFPIFEKSPIFEEPRHFRRTLYLRRARPFSIFGAGSTKNPPIFDLRIRKHEEPPIFNLRSSDPKIEESPIFDHRPRRMVRRSDGRRGGCDFFEDRGVLRRWGGSSIFRLRRTKNPPSSIFGAGRTKNLSSSTFPAGRMKIPPSSSSSDPPNQPSLGLLRVDPQTDLPARRSVRRLRSGFYPDKLLVYRSSTGRQPDFLFLHLFT